MKKILCIALVAAVAVLSSCSNNTDNTSSAEVSNVSSNTVSFLNKDDSVALKFFVEKELTDGNVCQMKVTRNEESGTYFVCLKEKRFNVSITENGTDVQYLYDDSAIYRIVPESKIATVIDGTEPYAVTLAKFCQQLDAACFVETGSTEINAVTYKSETFVTSEQSLDTLTFCLNEDNSVAFIKFDSASNDQYNVLIEIVGFSEASESVLFDLPEDYTVAS